MSDAKALLKKARAAKCNSYSPYSKFSVGAAVITQDGKVFCGTNVENASYGLSLCAERVAIFNAISSGSKEILAIAVTCPESHKESSLMPCGACLQVIAEFSSTKTTIIIDHVGEFKLTELLTKPFNIKSENN
jgi:cytidine deaminase